MFGDQLSEIAKLFISPKTWHGICDSNEWSWIS
jgi:hypothetical protein